MADIALFCEDRGHEYFARALVMRVARELGVEAQLRVVSASGGKGRALTQLKGWQRSFEQGLLVGKPDVVIVVIDGNCVTSQVKRREIEAILRPDVFPRQVIGCPDPHVERWCIADSAAFHQVVGEAPPADPGKCERNLYKQLLSKSLEHADQPILTDEMEISPDIVRAMDLDAAARAQPSLDAFVRDLRSAFKALR